MVLQMMERMFPIGLREKLGFWILLALFVGASSLTNVTVTIPPGVRIMDTVTLQCKYDLEGEPLYTVKWYKGAKEFFRFIPKELPNTLVFPLPGVDIDLSKSSSREVVLRNVQLESTGRYKCEVSTDAPNFYTFMASGYMFVIDVPEEDPVLSIETQLLDIGYILRGNCSSPPSFPAANITWLLNGKRIEETYLDHIQVSNSIPSYSARRYPTITVSTIEVEIEKDAFKSGTARLSCVASIFNAYKREREIVLEDERPRPRPSSVLGTRDANAGASMKAISTIIVHLLYSIVLFR